MKKVFASLLGAALLIFCAQAGSAQTSPPFKKPLQIRQGTLPEPSLGQGLQRVKGQPAQFGFNGQALIQQGFLVPGTAPQPNQLPAQSLPIGAKPIASVGRSAQLPTGSKPMPTLVKEVAFGQVPGKPIYFSTTTTLAPNVAKSQPEVRKAVLDLFAQNKQVLGLEKPENQFDLIESKTDELGMTHAKMQQYLNGVPVYGAEMIVHFGKDETSVTGQYQQKIAPNFNTTPAFDRATSVRLARKQAGAFRGRPTGIPEVDRHLLQEKSELIIYTENEAQGKYRLAYRLELHTSFAERWVYYIDAKNGQLIEKYSMICENDFVGSKAKGRDLSNTEREINTVKQVSTNTHIMYDISQPMYNAQASKLPENIVGGVIVLDSRNEREGDRFKLFDIVTTTNDFNNPAGVSAYHNAVVSYNYFRNVHGRNSIDGKGGTVFNIVNVPDNDGTPMDNAFWNGIAMAYGSGKNAFTNLAGALDVGGHEMSHGVIGNSANLEYKFQSGALNESFADIFGAMIEREDWRLAEDVVKNGFFPSGAMRDMKNPNNGATKGQLGWQPAHMDEFQNLPIEQDKGGVHVNSGIPNRAYVLFAEAIGSEKAEKIYYRALTQYLTVSSQFVDCRIAVIKSAKDLHGDNSPEMNAAKAAFDAVGIREGQGTPPRPDNPENPGTELLLVVESGTGKPYLSVPDGSQVAKLSDRALRGRPSVTDNGSFVFFISAAQELIMLDLTKEPIQETVIDNTTPWHGVAVSPDGKFLALLTEPDDKAEIYIYDIAKDQIRAFELFNPTTGQNQTPTTAPIYADAIYWDAYGHVIYDAFNSIQSNFGNFEYWDMGFLKAWDYQKNTWGDGGIGKFFERLPAGISVGNPSLGKTNPLIMTFDWYDAINEVNEVMAMDIAKGTAKPAFANTEIGVPSYSKNDRKIAFTAKTNDGKLVVATVNMAEDKVTVVPNSLSLILENAKWPVFFAIGTRSTTPPLNAPVAQAATNVTTTSFTASWSAVAGASFYRVDVATDANFTQIVPGLNQAQVNGTGANVSGLQPGTTYHYRVKAVNEATSSDFSNKIAVQTQSNTPTLNAPTLLPHSQITASGFTIAWNAVQGATHYKVDIATDVNFNQLVVNQAQVNGVSYAATGLQANTMYFYRVKAFSANAASAFSSTMQVQTQTAQNPPAAPVAQAASQLTTSGFQANWGAVANATKYQLDVATNANFTQFVTGYQNKEVNGTSEAVTNLQPNTDYWYRVRAVANGLISTNSNAVAVKTQPNACTPPAAPQANGVSICAGNSATLTASGANRYRWYESPNATEFLQESTNPAFVTGALAQTKTYYVASVANGCESARVAVTVTVTAALAKPTITVEGSTNPPTAEYVLVSSADEGNQWYRNGQAIAGATNKRYSVTQTGTYTVKVVANGCESPMSEPAPVLTGIEDEIAASFELYPNPATDQLSVAFTYSKPIGQVEARVFSLTGQHTPLVSVEKHIGGAYTTSLDVSQLPNGLYILRIVGNNLNHAVRFVKQ